MAQVPEGYEELIYAAANDIDTILSAGYEPDAKLVQKGLLLYRQGLVTKVRYEDQAITSTVQDVTPVFVQMELNFFQTSSCSCPADGLCRHIMATFFYAYGGVDSVADWVEAWRRPLHEKKIASDLGLKRAKDLLKASGILKPDYDRWIQAFEESFQTIMYGQGLPRPYLVPELYQVLTRRIRATAPVEQEWKQLYLLISHIFIFRKLLVLSKDSGHSDWDIERNYQQIFYTIIDEIESIIHKLSVHALPFAFDEFITRLKDDTIELLLAEVELEYERTQAYQLLWYALFKKKHWRETELERLQQLQGQLQGTVLVYQPHKELEHENRPHNSLVIATIHLQLLLRQDEAALAAVQKLEEEVVPYLLLWLEEFKVNRDWKRMSPFVDVFISLLRRYLSVLANSYACFDFTRYALRILQSYCTETNRIDLYEKSLAQLLPYSYREYEHFLFIEQQYEKWSDLQAYIGYDMSSIPSDKIKELQKAQPDVLLPLYHQSIQKNIDLKNRGNYRQAVRELKKLRTIYKKMKRQSEFDQYFQTLLERTKRLRAFQEECQRGKLIHVEN